MNLNEEKGITLAVLIITVIIMIILAMVTAKFGNDAIDKAKLEDIKTDMLSIKTKAKIIVEQYNFKDRTDLVGVLLDSDATQEGIQLGTYTISNELKAIFEEKNEDESPKMDISKLYIWTVEDLVSEGLNTIKADENNFYIVYYNMEDPNNCEIYYSGGYNAVDCRKYSLTELENI